MRAIGGILLRGSLVVAILAGCTDDPEAESTDDVHTVEDVGMKPDVPAMLADDRESSPAELQVVDLVDGDGEEATPGSLVTVHYAGALWHDGVELDSTWDVDEPYTFELGSGRVIQGWEDGIGGSGGTAPMRVGGRRMLTIPADLAYGDRGASGDIGPGEPLVFVIDLLDVEPAA